MVLQRVISIFLLVVPMHLLILYAIFSPIFHKFCSVNGVHLKPGLSTFVNVQQDKCRSEDL